jgi:hypothetical protein
MFTSFAVGSQQTSEACATKQSSQLPAFIFLAVRIFPSRLGECMVLWMGIESKNRWQNEIAFCHF